MYQIFQPHNLQHKDEIRNNLIEKINCNFKQIIKTNKTLKYNLINEKIIDELSDKNDNIQRHIRLQYLETDPNHHATKTKQKYMYMSIQNS